MCLTRSLHRAFRLSGLLCHLYTLLSRLLIVHSADLRRLRSLLSVSRHLAITPTTSVVPYTSIDRFSFLVHHYTRRASRGRGCHAPCSLQDICWLLTIASLSPSVSSTYIHTYIHFIVSDGAPSVGLYTLLCAVGLGGEFAFMAMHCDVAGCRAISRVSCDLHN